MAGIDMRVPAGAAASLPGAAAYERAAPAPQPVADGRHGLTSNQALNGFLAEVERRAFRMAQLATGNADDALDIVQDAMFKLVQRYADHDAGEWAPLFYRILQSRINDFHRRRAVRNRVMAWFGRRLDDEGEELPDPMDGVAGDVHEEPDARLHGQRAAQEIYRALQRLPARQQQAFLLRAWEGLDTAETARAMGCSEGSVKTHYSRAVHALRDRLGDDWR